MYQITLLSQVFEIFILLIYFYISFDLKGTERERDRESLHLWFIPTAG